MRERTRPSSSPSSRATGADVDALVANAWDGLTPYKSVQVSVCQKGPYKNNSSWEAGGNTYNRHEPSPQALFDRLFETSFPAATTG
jgi:hypothetical protein